MQNSYMRIKKQEPVADVTKGLEDAYRIINSIYMVKVKPMRELSSPATLIPGYPDLPMEDVYPRIPETDIRTVYLDDTQRGRVVYFPGDIDRSFWQLMTADHSTLLRNTIRWALNEEPVVEVTGPGVMDVTAWRQEGSMTVHLVNLTNPMLMKGPFREFIPVSAGVTINLPADSKPAGVYLCVADVKPEYTLKGNKISLEVKNITDHEIIAVDLF